MEKKGAILVIRFFGDLDDLASLNIQKILEEVGQQEYTIGYYHWDYGKKLEEGILNSIKEGRFKMIIVTHWAAQFFEGYNQEYKKLEAAIPPESTKLINLHWLDVGWKDKETIKKTIAENLLLIKFPRLRITTYIKRV